MQSKGLGGKILSEGTFHSYRGECSSGLVPALPEGSRKVSRVYYVSHGGTFASCCEGICSSIEQNLLASDLRASRGERALDQGTALLSLKIGRELWY